MTTSRRSVHERDPDGYRIELIEQATVEQTQG